MSELHFNLFDCRSLAFGVLDGASVTIFLGIRVMFASSNSNKLEIYVL